MEYLKVRNFEKFQHYKDRNPKWIKLHSSILEDYEFNKLPDASKAHLISIWVLASRLDNRIPNDPDWISQRIGASETIDTQTLVSTRFLEVCQQSARESLEQCVQSDCLEESKEEGEESYSPDGDSSSAKPKTPPPCPHEKIIDIYHEILPELPSVKIWSDTRASHLRARWREDEKRQDLDWWKQYFQAVKESDFLMGRVVGRDGSSFRADLEWLVRPKNFVKVIEGRYVNRDDASTDSGQRTGIWSQTLT